MNIFDQEEIIDISNRQVEMPERSRLFSLQPAGLGTPQQESLLSLLVRTCQAHAVNPRVLIKQIFTEVDQDMGRLLTAAFFQRLSGTMNGLGQYAESFVSIMEILTKRSNLNRLTCLLWQNLLPFNGQGLLARHRQWCPVCLDLNRYEESFAFPLVWALEGYQCCQTHGVLLEYQCPACRKAQPMIPPYPNLAICSHCKQSLASAGTRKAQSEFRVWVSKALENMVIAQSRLDFEASVERFHDFVREQVEIHTQGNRAAFCRALGLHEYAVSGWLNKGEKPSITHFLAVCYGADVMPAKLFLEDFYESSRMLRTLQEKQKERSRSVNSCIATNKLLQRALQRYINKGAGQSFLSISRKLKVSRAYLRYWFPSLCRQISEQYRDAIIKRSDALHADQIRQVAKIIENIREEGRYPSRRIVSKELKQIFGITLSQPHLRRTHCFSARYRMQL